MKHLSDIARPGFELMCHRSETNRTTFYTIGQVCAEDEADGLILKLLRHCVLKVGVQQLPPCVAAAVNTEFNNQPGHHLNLYGCCYLS